ncbi:11846_t:CDS:1 [Acaulospora morrowiae]|uniref:11846_t:CDS:1 n=1 Tax=Acaulospora morrowiae TaxID=94023 RepID=A0A9N9HWP8_9GLOM|nr:11846_t:CDS:1 [Acaulospora morrowiae]
MSQWTDMETEDSAVSTKSQNPLQQQRNNRQERKNYSQVYSNKFFPNARYQFVDFLGGVDYTFSQDKGVVFNRVISFFRDITNTIELTKGIIHFKLAVEQNLNGFGVRIIEAEKSLKPPRKTLNCISCDVESETNKASMLDYPPTVKEDMKLHNIWIDAKARSMFIITPIRHVERLSECTDEEVFSMFSLAIQILYEEMRASDAPWRQLRFERMVLNHGNSRNVEHLHLKIRVPPDDFEYYMNHGWNDAKKQKYSILASGLYKRDERLKKIC